MLKSLPTYYILYSMWEVISAYQHYIVITIYRECAHSPSGEHGSVLNSGHGC